MERGLTQIQTNRPIRIGLFDYFLSGSFFRPPLYSLSHSWQAIALYVKPPPLALVCPCQCELSGAYADLVLLGSCSLFSQSI